MDNTLSQKQAAEKIKQLYEMCIRDRVYRHRVQRDFGSVYLINHFIRLST